MYLILLYKVNRYIFKFSYKKGGIFLKTRIEVPKEFEEIVLRNGAKFDKRVEQFYVPKNVFISAFNSFIPLTIELIPSSNWRNNVRSEYKDDWG